MISERFICVVIAALWWLGAVSGQCPQNKYGPDCKYDCHCGPGVDCNPLTGCSGNCADGWDGSTCQRQNVALQQAASHSPDTYCDENSPDRCHNASLAVDGKRGHNFFTTTCTQAGRTSNLNTLAEWNVTLDRTYNIYRFAIDVRHGGCCDGRINQFVLSVGETSSGSANYRECYRDQTTGGPYSNGPGSTIKGNCGNYTPLRGNVVQIKQTRTYPLTLCEVLIYVCSEKWYEEECNYECETSSNCSHCDSSQLRCEECRNGKWGEHCFQKCFCLGGAQCAKIEGRCPDNKCAAGYKGPSCNIGCDGGEYGPDCGQRCGYCAEGRTVCDRTTGECPDRSPIPRCQAGYQGRKCDEKCTAGTYGADCKQPCGQCAGGSDKCDRVDGWCPSTETPRCAPGWTGNKCKTECLPGRYGGGCREYCGNCRGGRDKCDKVNGACPDEGGVKCADGYDGNLCKTECLPGHYGGDCREQCGNCRGGKDKCDTVNGVCPYVGGVRCADGYLGDQCKTECDDGYYGSNCAEECGNCVDGSGSCHHTDGSCQGCAAGWKGTVCKTNCSSYRWGPDCEETCGQCHDGAVCDLVSGECPTGDPRCDTGHIGLRCTPLVIDYTGVIIGSVMSVIVAAAIITALVLVVRRRQSGSPDGTESSARNTGVTYEVPIPEVPNAGHDSDTVTYYNMAVEEEGHYETVTEKEYDKIRFSLLETDKDTNYTNLSSTVYPNTRVSSTKQ